MTDTVTADVTVTDAVAVFAGSATLVAAIVTEAGEGNPAGAVYNPLVDTIPTVEFPPANPFTDQVTPVFVALLTLAVNCFVAEV
ncbi:MAG: hypothetical protein JJE04_26760 [Acidobacteriia bacterium]|nr:hypothetical protein [Terriglobia bacterium]